VIHVVLPLQECVDPAPIESATEPLHSVANFAAVESTAKPLQSAPDSAAAGAAQTEIFCS
jgi:hypothetical protein